MGIGSFKELFPFAPLPLASPNSNSSSTVNANDPTIKRPSGHDKTAPPSKHDVFGITGSMPLLYRLANGPLRKIKALSNPLSSEQRKFITHLLKQASANELNLLTKSMCQLITIILRPTSTLPRLATENLQVKTLAEKVAEKHTNINELFASLLYVQAGQQMPALRVPVSCLSDVASLIIEHAGDDKSFPDFPATLKMALPLQAVKALDGISQLCAGDDDDEDKAVDYEELERLRKLIADLIEQFSTPFIVNDLKVNLEFAKLRQPIETLIDSSLPLLTAEHSKERLDRILGLAVTVCHYCTFLRKLQNLVTQLRETLVAKKLAETRSKGSGVYNELLPTKFTVVVAPTNDAASVSADNEGMVSNPENYFPSDFASIVSNALNSQTAVDDPPVRAGGGLLGDVPQGLPNIGNTCFMNSAVQIIAAVPEIYSRLVATVSTEELCNEPWWYGRKSPEALLCCLRNVLSVILASSPHGVDRQACEHLYSQMALHSSEFTSLQQGDAHEWISTLVAILSDHEALAPLRSMSKYTTKCSRCSHVSTSTAYEAITSLPINLPSMENQLQVVSLDELFNSAAAWPVREWYVSMQSRSSVSSVCNYVGLFCLGVVNPARPWWRLRARFTSRLVLPISCATL